LSVLVLALRSSRPFERRYERRRRWNGVIRSGESKVSVVPLRLSTGEVPSAFVACLKSIVSRSTAARTSFCRVACSSTRLLVFELVMSIWPKAAITMPITAIAAISSTAVNPRSSQSERRRSLIGPSPSSSSAR